LVPRSRGRVRTGPPGVSPVSPPGVGGRCSGARTRRGGGGGWPRGARRGAGTAPRRPPGDSPLPLQKGGNYARPPGPKKREILPLIYKKIGAGGSGFSHPHSFWRLLSECMPFSPILRIMPWTERHRGGRGWRRPLPRGPQAVDVVEGGVRPPLLLVDDLQHTPPLGLRRDVLGRPSASGSGIAPDAVHCHRPLCHPPGRGML